MQTNETAVRRTFEYAAYCMWLNEFDLAHDADDASRQSHAADVLADATAWPSIVATDGGGIVEQMTAVAESAAAAETEMVRAQIDADCDPSWTPEAYE